MSEIPQEIFTPEDVQKMLANKFVVIIGSSIQRSMYKDLILLLQQPRRLYQQELRKKGEPSVCGDKLVEGSALTNSKTYQEVRQYQSKDGFHLVRFYFVTRCYSTYLETILADLMKEPKPDIIIMNSCLWDISRFGARSIKEYQINVQKALQRFHAILPLECLFIWNTQLPVSKKIRGGFLLPEIAFMAEVLGMDILRANNYAQKVAVDYGFDVVDLHYYFRSQLQHRAADGVHWDQVVHRRITNLLLVHICEAWGLGLPARRPPTIMDLHSMPNPRPYRPPLLSVPQTIAGQCLELLGSYLGYPSQSHQREQLDRYGGPIENRQVDRYGGPMENELLDCYGGPVGDRQMDRYGGPVEDREMDRYGGPLEDRQMDQYGGPMEDRQMDRYGGPMEDRQMDRYGSPMEDQQMERYGGPINRPSYMFNNCEPFNDTDIHIEEQFDGFNQPRDFDMRSPLYSESVSEAEVRYGGPINRPSYLDTEPTFPVPLPVRRHVRSASCDPAYLRNGQQGGVRRGNNLTSMRQLQGSNGQQRMMSNNISMAQGSGLLNHPPQNRPVPPLISQPQRPRTTIRARPCNDFGPIKKQKAKSKKARPWPKYKPY